MSILSFQSHVAFGHVGHAAAVFPLQRLGHEVWPVHVLQFSNHPGHGRHRGMVFPAEHIAEIVEGIGDLGMLTQCHAVLSGYLGNAGIAQVVLDAVRRVKAANADALYLCDPVIGDIGKGVYVQPELAAFFRDIALASADILTPNLFELGWLTGQSIADEAGLVAALDSIHARGVGMILVTSADLYTTPAAATDLVLSSRGKAGEISRHRLRTPRMAGQFSGAGDTLAALFLGHLLAGIPPVQALEKAGSSLADLIARSAEAGSRDVLTIAGQEAFMAPRRGFEASWI